MRGRLIGDDNAFDDEGIGAGWAWDYLTDDYAAPSGALSYNENVVTYRIAPGEAEGDPAAVTSAPAGATFERDQQRATGASRLERQRVTGSHARQPRTRRLGPRRCGGRHGLAHDDDRQPDAVFRRSACGWRSQSRGIRVSEGAVDVDDAKMVAPADAGARSSRAANRRRCLHSARTS